MSLEVILVGLLTAVIGGVITAYIIVKLKEPIELTPTDYFYKYCSVCEVYLKGHRISEKCCDCVDRKGVQF